MMVGGEFGDHALILSIPQYIIQLWKVLEDVKAILCEVSSGPTAEF